MLYTLSDLVATVGPTFAGRSSFTPTAGRFTLAESGPRPAMRARRSAHVAQSREPQQGEVRGVLRHPKGNFFDWRGWTGERHGEFSGRFGDYVEWCRRGKLKKSLGRKTIGRRRAELVYAA